MLTNVPNEVNRLARQVTLHHPNAMDCTVWRKVLNRVDATPPESFGGLPTIGGLGQLDSEDEANYSWEEVGDAKIVFTGSFVPSSSNIIDTEDGINYSDSPMEALIECILAPENEGFFIPDKPMVVTVEPGAGLMMPYQIVGVGSPGSIPPYHRKYVLNPMADFDQGI